MKYTAIITAGGTSSRFGGTTNKLLEKIHGKEILKYTVEAFLQANIDEVIEIIRNSYDDAKERLMARFGFSDIQAQGISEVFQPL